MTDFILVCLVLIFILILAVTIYLSDRITQLEISADRLERKAERNRPDPREW